MIASISYLIVWLIASSYRFYTVLMGDFWLRGDLYSDLLLTTFGEPSLTGDYLMSCLKNSGFDSLLRGDVPSTNYFYLTIF